MVLDSNWPGQVSELLQNQACVLVTVVSVKGSAPRAIGSRMIVTTDRLYGSIGGGNLEYEATGTARSMLNEAQDSYQQNHVLGLGPALNQCCGGAVTLLFEAYLSHQHECLHHLESCRKAGESTLLLTAIDRDSISKWVLNNDTDRGKDIPDTIVSAVNNLTDSDKLPCLLGDPETGMYLLERMEHQQLPVFLFGAGHVARAVVRELASQPFQIRWIDSRAAEFPEHVPGDVEVVVTDNPVCEILEARAGTIFLVMTHSHELDEAICFEILQRDDEYWLGLIGSITKRRRFEHRLSSRGISEKQLSKLVCPVGMAGITGKRPATIAVSIAAQLLQELVPANWR